MIYFQGFLNIEDENLRKAIEAVQSNQLDPSVAAKMFGVSRYLLVNKLSKIECEARKKYNGINLLEVNIFSKM